MIDPNPDCDPDFIAGLYSSPENEVLLVEYALKIGQNAQAQLAATAQSELAQAAQVAQNIRGGRPDPFEVLE